jgi:hypothetical protein
MRKYILLAVIYIMPAVLLTAFSASITSEGLAFLVQYPWKSIAALFLSLVTGGLAATVILFGNHAYVAKRFGLMP